MIVKDLEFGLSLGESSLLPRKIVISLGNLSPSLRKGHYSPGNFGLFHWESLLFRRNFGTFLEENSMLFKETTIVLGKFGPFPWKIHCSLKNLLFKELLLLHRDFNLFHGEFTLLLKATCLRLTFSFLFQRTNFKDYLNVLCIFSSISFVGKKIGKMIEPLTFWLKGGF
jgi:hypothetical protein